jgi:hypothetical protein
MRVGGPNGFAIVMLLLSWWGWAATTAEEKAAWRASVASVTSAIDTMLGKGKRKAGTASNMPAHQAKRYVFLCCAIRTTK